MTYPLVTFPWFDRQEVSEVLEGLYSDDLNRQKLAVSRVEVWEARALSRLPLAAETTSALVKANIDYQSAEKPVGNNIILREKYSMAIIRFVNLFTERNQQKAHALPVHVVASRLGVPAWIVDIRHSASHDSLPSLAELRAAAHWCLQWLKSEFWEVQCMETSTAFESKMKNVQTFRDQLVTYMQRKFSSLKTEEPTPSKILLSKIEISVNDLGEEVCHVVFEDGYFLFTEDQLLSIGLSQHDITNTTEAVLPMKIIEFWKPILHLLNKCKLLPSLLIYLVASLGQYYNLRSAFMLKWLYTLLDNGEKNNKSPLFGSNSDIPCKTLLAMCMRSKVDALGVCVEILIRKAKLLPQAKPLLLKLSQLMDTDAENETADEFLYTVNDLLKKRTCDNHWKICTENIFWSQVPFGLLPDQEIDFTSIDSDETYPDIHTMPNDIDAEIGEDSENEETMNISEISPADTLADSSETKNMWDGQSLESLINHSFLL